MARTKKYQPTEFMLPTSYYDKERADHAVNFIQSLKHTNAHGRGLDRPKGLEGREPVAGQDGGHRVLQDGL